MNASLAREIEKATGQKIEDLQSTPIAERRRAIEKKHKKPFRFTRNFPFVGRGSVMGDQTLSRQQVDRILMEILD